ncbi:MAG: polysaccharide deacetylase family protein [archaeon YNP-LCB-024-027]|nr:polysaccharide deacetylase family protein [Candidatus Culexarchaeum yellowstonense]
MVENILSIDVEEVFHGEYVRQRGHSLYYRTPSNIPLILEILEEYNIKATFFIVGEIAEKFPEVINMILEKGHEVSFHGWIHEPLWRLTPEQFRKEVRAFKKLHPHTIGFRAPSFSLNNETMWALKILYDEGFKYDSSIFPTWTPLYGTYKAPMHPYHPSLTNIIKEDETCPIIEFPLAVYKLFRLIKVPIAGGFWLRLWNLGLIKRGIKKINNKGFPAVIYIHNWELDEKTPKINAGILGRFQVYHNLNKAKQKLASLLSEFKFTNFSTYIKDALK